MDFFKFWKKEQTNYPKISSKKANQGKILDLTKENNVEESSNNLEEIGRAHV